MKERGDMRVLYWTMIVLGIALISIYEIRLHYTPIVVQTKIVAKNLEKTWEDDEDDDSTEKFTYLWDAAGDVRKIV